MGRTGLGSAYVLVAADPTCYPRPLSTTEGVPLVPTDLTERMARPAIMHAMAEYTYLVLRLPRGTTRDAARQLLTEHAEIGGWELDRLRLYPDGRRHIRLRRRIIRQTRTF
jgi:hypothetical protein